MMVYYKRLQSGILWLLLGFVIGTCPTLAQDSQKKLLTKTDYDLWGQLVIGTVSSNGKWMSWGIRYPDGRDTAFAGNTTKNEILLTLPGAKPGLFFGKQSYASVDATGGFTVYDLDRNKSWRKEGIKGFEVLPPNRQLLLERPDKDGLYDIVLVNYAGEELVSFCNVKFWSANPQKTTLALTVQDKETDRCLLVHNSDFKVLEIAQYLPKGMGKGEWDQTGQFLAMAGTGKDDEKGRLFLYHLRTAKLSVYDPKVDKEFPGDRNISSISAAKLLIDENGKGVFFGTTLKQKPMLEDDSFVQVWNSSDILIYPAKRMLEGSRKFRLGYWDVAENKIRTIADSITPNASVTGNRRFGITWDPNAYEPQFERDGPSDYFLMDIRDGQKRPWLLRQPAGSVFPIVGSDLILYRNDGWNIYDPATDSTRKISIPLYAPEFKQSEQPASDLSGKWLVFQDGYDLWKYDTRNGNTFRLTNGKENGLIYSLPENGLQNVELYRIHYLRCFDFSKPLTVKVCTKDGELQGYRYILPDGRLKYIVMDKMRYTAIATNSEASTFGLISESFASPSAIQVVHRNKLHQLFVSNSHQQKFAWGKAELVKYVVDGKDAQGILYVPDGIDPKKRYPMITHIYEKQSDHLHESILPSLYNKIGFNVANLVNSGYFVFLPDMVFGMGNPGADANRSVNAAIDKVLSHYPVDSSRLGIIGHSFGGYEVASILTLNKRFACAIVGAGIYDAVGYYLSPNRNNSKPNYWRYEFDQERIGKSLFEDKETYLANSPVLQADKIVTPVMIWSGDNDEQVPFEQAVHFHLALRRLGKQSSLLVYPGGTHGIFEKKGDKDLTGRVIQWFDHFLRDKKSEWIK